MTYFIYNRQAPCPTDKYIYDILKNFNELLKKPLELWKKDVVNGLLMERGYIDIISAKMRVGRNKDGLVPIISIRPVVDEESEELIRYYGEFFDTYTQLRSAVYREIRSNLSHPAKIRPDAKRIVAYINSIKMAIHSFKHDKFDSIDFIPAIDDPLTTVAANRLRSIELSEIVGEKFQQGGLLCEDDPEELLHSFIRYVRKQMIREQQAAVDSLVGWPLQK